MDGRSLLAGWGENGRARPLEGMARPARIELPGGAYHLIARGNGRQSIYTDDADRHAFLKVLRETLSRTVLRISPGA